MPAVWSWNGALLVMVTGLETWVDWWERRRIATASGFEVFWVRVWEAASVLVLVVLKVVPVW